MKMKYFCVGLLALSSGLWAAGPLAAPKKPLAERLGFPPGTKVVIINGDDFGMNHGGTQATINAIKAGGLTSASIMVPCPWFPMVVEFARQTPGVNLGIHITLTAEWRRYKWGPVLGRTAVPSLVDEYGHFPSILLTLYNQARIEEVEAETRAQIDRALQAGIDVTHLDAHSDSLASDPEYHELYLKIAKSYNLPIRLHEKDLRRDPKTRYLAEMADTLGLLYPESDRAFAGGMPDAEAPDTFWPKVVRSIPPGGVRELTLHPGMMTPEMEATTGAARFRTADTEYFSRKSTIEWSARKVSKSSATANCVSCSELARR